MSADYPSGTRVRLTRALTNRRLLGLNGQKDEREDIYPIGTEAEVVSHCDSGVGLIINIHGPHGPFTLGDATHAGRGNTVTFFVDAVDVEPIP